MKYEIKTNQLNFILAGSSQFVLENDKTGNHFSYLVKKQKTGVWYIYSSTDYLGALRANMTAKIEVSMRTSLKSVAIFWYLKQLIDKIPIPPQVHLYHLGRCGKCGRPLTDPASMERGIGPYCAGLKP